MIVRGRIVLAGSILSCFLGVSAGGSPPLPLAPSPRLTVIELIGRLGSEDFREREEAAAQLARLEEPPPQLIEATRSPNPEISQRAIQVVRTIRARAEDRALGRERVFAKRGAIDRFVASTAFWELPSDDDRIWQTVLDVATALDDRTNYRWRIAGKKRSISPADFWLVTIRVTHTRSEGVYRVPEKNRGGEAMQCEPGGILAQEVIAPQALDRNLVVARGPVRAETRIVQSVILANGDVAAKHGLEVSVVVCDGSVQVEDSVRDCIVIARGDITIKGSASRSTLIAGGKVTIGNPPPPENSPQLTLQENSRNPLGFVTFFELSTVGVEVKLGDAAVKVTAVADGKPFAKAGVKAGDVITGVNGKKPDSAESLRRLLRDALAVGDATVTLRRGDKTQTVTVALPE